MKNIVITTINKIVVTTLAMLLLIACNDDFMDRFPETSISPESFFNTVKDLELYTNPYYTYTPQSYMFGDAISDNSTGYSNTFDADNDVRQLVQGNLTLDNVAGWTRGDWGALRSYNFFLENAGKASGDEAAIKHYFGIIRLQRAIWYYNMVKKYGDVPWYSGTLSDTDEDLLYKARDPRTLVVDSVMADLDYAVSNMLEEMGNRTRFSRWYAAAMMARICLHEGTFRKYHQYLNLQGTANTYLNKAVEAADIVMKSGNFDIDKTGGKDNAYHYLFIRKLANNREMILFRQYDNNIGLNHFAGTRTANGNLMTRSLMESYQYITPDGKTVPFSTVPGYETMDYVKLFENRDPRLTQTFMCPGYVIPGTTQPFRPNLNLGGYHPMKYVSDNPSHFGSASPTQDTDLPLFRYAELLLIYAEAKAELGNLTQDDLDKSINLIRSRVDLPPTVIGGIVEDASLKAQFPDVTDYLILEIRRERRIELVYEQLRWDDLTRWKAGHLIQKVGEGMYIAQLGVFDVNGDGTPTMGIFESEATNTVPEAERSNYSFYYLKNAAGEPGPISLTNGTSGYIVISGERDTRVFKDPQYYYLPINRQHILLNPNLKQTIFWEE